MKGESWLSKLDRNMQLIKLCIIILVPLLMLPLPIAIQTPEANCAYVLIWTALYWCTEALPLGVTALLPAFLMPLFGIVESRDITLNYMKENIMLAMGGFIVAVAIERWNLHRRIALRILLIVGFSPPRLLFGFMLTTALLSMWISNTATTTMMIPIVEAVLQQLKAHLVTDHQYTQQLGRSELAGDEETDQECPVDTLHTMEAMQIQVLQTQEMHSGSEGTDETHFKRTCKAMCLGVAYSACFGGSSTLIGTGPIMLTVAHVEKVFEDKGLDSGVTFAKWMARSVPMSTILIIIGWLWLQVFWFGPSMTFKYLFKRKTEREEESNQAIEMVLKQEYKTLGQTSFAEWAVLVHFSMLAILWLTRDPGFMPGWEALFRDGYVGASVPAILIATMLFIFPSKSPFHLRQGETVSGNLTPLMDLATMSRKVPWHILLLFGGGMAIADGCKESGLSAWLGSQMGALQSMPTWLLISLVCLFLSLLTEFSSNVTIISIVMPILAEMAVTMNLNPLYLMLPSGIACTYAFMLPVATAPNAIIFSYGHLKVIDMVKSGCVMNLICIMVVGVAANTWGIPIWNYDFLPPGWETGNNATTAMP